MFLLGISIKPRQTDAEIFFEVIKNDISRKDQRSKKTGKCRCKEDAAVLEKFSDAEIIKPLIRKKKLTVIEHVIDFITTPGVVDVVDAVNDMSQYYFIEKGSKQYLVNVTKEAMITTELTRKITENKFVIGKNKFIKVAYEIR